MARASRTTWAKRVAAWRRSGLTAAAFARRTGVSEGSLRWWSWRLSSDARHDDAASPAASLEPATSLSPLTFIEMPTALADAVLEIVLVNGTRLRVPSGSDISTVERLLDLLQRR